MPRFLELSDGSLNGLTNQFITALEKKLTSSQARSRLTAAVKPFVAKAIAQAIGGKSGAGNTAAARAFRPLSQPNSDELVGRLGVGKDGSVDTAKLNNGWRVLVPSNSGRATGGSASTVNGTFSAASIKSGNFGRFNLDIDLDAFYNARVNTFGYFNRSGAGGSQDAAEALVIVPWMKHFIEGVEVPGFGFVKPSSPAFQKARNSENFSRITRTGLGFMIKIPSGSFRIAPATPSPFTTLLAAITRTFESKQFADGIKIEIARALR
jgi:hypothetical protein